MRLRWGRCRGEAHLSRGEGGEDFYIPLREDVVRSPGGVVPSGEYEEAEEGGVVRRRLKGMPDSLLMSAATYSGLATQEPVHR